MNNSIDYYTLQIKPDGADNCFQLPWRSCSTALRNSLRGRTTSVSCSSAGNQAAGH
ncbi:hypothetical protein HUK38_04185 [Thiospirillum jenense]|uniref:Uncharacterized protein n=1 Tax=Thiospirillum jenense TaxID=1653858 RepID=A0A839HEH5_9GAMM|nr:hypothetical protein [Thiospirillum jenense]